MKSVKGDRQSDRQTKPVIEVLATPGRGSDRPQEIKYTDTKIIGNGSFGVVYQAVMINQDNTDEVIAIKKVFFVTRRFHPIYCVELFSTSGSNFKPEVANSLKECFVMNLLRSFKINASKTVNFQ